MGADEYGRELNNLYFNQRMSNSLYIGYGVDSSSKCEELEELLKNNNIHENDEILERKEKTTVQQHAQTQSSPLLAPTASTFLYPTPHSQRLLLHARQRELNLPQSTIKKKTT